MAKKKNEQVYDLDELFQEDKKELSEQYKVRFRNLSGWVKLAVIGGFLSLLLNGGAFLYGFMIGLGG